MTNKLAQRYAQYAHNKIAKYDPYYIAINFLNEIDLYDTVTFAEVLIGVNQVTFVVQDFIPYDKQRQWQFAFHIESHKVDHVIIYTLYDLSRTLYVTSDKATFVRDLLECIDQLHNLCLIYDDENDI